MANFGIDTVRSFKWSILNVIKALGASSPNYYACHYDKSIFLLRKRCLNSKECVYFQALTTKAFQIYISNRSIFHLVSQFHCVVFNLRYKYMSCLPKKHDYVLWFISQYFHYGHFFIHPFAPPQIRKHSIMVMFSYQQFCFTHIQKPHSICGHHVACGSFYAFFLYIIMHIHSSLLTQNQIQLPHASCIVHRVCKCV